MKKRRVFSAMIAAALCTMLALPTVTAQAEYLLDEAKLEGDENYMASCYVVLDATDPSADQLLFYNLGLYYSTAKGTGSFGVSPVSIWNYATLETKPALFPSTYAPDQKEVEVGDVLVFHGNFLTLESYLGTIVSESDSPLKDEPTYIENIGRYDELLHTEELTLVEKNEPVLHTSEDKMGYAVAYTFDDEPYSTSFTFVNDEGRTYTFSDENGYFIQDLRTIEPGATVKAITYLDTAVPMEVLTDAPLPEGDPDEDGAVNAKDASAVLMTAAQIGAKRKPSLTLAQRNACDVNKDGAVNAKDASYILRYAAYIGAKNLYVSISEFLN